MEQAADPPHASTEQPQRLFAETTAERRIEEGLAKVVAACARSRRHVFLITAACWPNCPSSAQSTSCSPRATAPNSAPAASRSRANTKKSSTTTTTSG
jgi:hypothetical protein